MDLEIHYDKSPISLMEDAFKAPRGTPIKIPPSYALGQYHLVRNLKSNLDFVQIWNNYKDKYKWPLEGFMLDLNFTGY